jgi:hypothetical protein
MNVGVMKDYKLRDLRASHTLGWSWNWNTKDKDLSECQVYYESISLFIMKR